MSDSLFCRSDRDSFLPRIRPTDDIASAEHFLSSLEAEFQKIRERCDWPWDFSEDLASARKAIASNNTGRLMVALWRMSTFLADLELERAEHSRLVADDATARNDLAGDRRMTPRQDRRANQERRAIQIYQEARSDGLNSTQAFKRVASSLKISESTARTRVTDAGHYEPRRRKKMGR